MLTEKHLHEFLESGIPKEIAETIFRSVSNPEEIAAFLGWKGYQGPPGWLYEGIDPLTGKSTGIGQFKPDGGIIFPDGSKAKYLSQKGSDGKGKYDACCLRVPGINWQEVSFDTTRLVRNAEGAKKAIASMLYTGVPTIALSGVDMATFGRGGQLTPTLAALAVPGRPSEIAYDSDIIEKKGVRSAATALGRSLQKAGCLVTVRLWSQDLGKGIDDAIVNVGVEEFERQSRVQNLDDWMKPVKKAKEDSTPTTSSSDTEEEPETKKPKLPAQSTIAAELATIFKNTLAWRPTYKKWYRYGAENNGSWTHEEKDFITRLISMELSARGFKHSDGYVTGTINLLKAYLAVKGWDEASGLLPARNGVINLQTLEVLPHSPNYKFTWQLPYDYEPGATCKPIIDWLLQSVKGNHSLVEMLRAYLASTIRGRTDIHGFIELLGPGGSGKSTFMHLATMLVGENNTHITKLKKLEGNFETACLMDKRLVLITDSDKYQGSVDTLKALTGGDRIPYEEKFLQSRAGFQPRCKVIISCNEPIQSPDYTSGLQRRRFVIPFENKVEIENQRTLLQEVDGKLQGEFLDYLPGLLNWVLAVSSEQVERYLKRTREAVTGYTRIAMQAIVSTNPIADWVDKFLIFEEGARLQVGVAQKNKDNNINNSYLNINSWMYASYAEFCATTGVHLLSLKRFINLANDLFANQLKLNVRHSRDRVSAFFENLRIRTEFDETGGLISSGDDEPSTPPAHTASTPPPTVSTPPAPAHKPAAASSPTEPDWKTFPSAENDSTETRKNKALACKNHLSKVIKKAKNRKEAKEGSRWTSEEVNWTTKNLLTTEQIRKLQAILANDQTELDL